MQVQDAVQRIQLAFREKDFFRCGVSNLSSCIPAVHEAETGLSMQRGSVFRSLGCWLKLLT